MRPTIDLRPVLQFLSELEENNNKTWFDRNRARYELARDCFVNLVELLIARIATFDDLGGISAKDCIFRINRDIRFSKDKTPYKTNMGAHIAAGGRNSGHVGYYLHLQPHDRSMLAGGLYEPSSEELTRFRQAIDRDAGRFRAIINAKSFRRIFPSIEGERLVKAPQGYAGDHPDIDLLRLKQVTVMHPVTDALVLSPDFPLYAVKVFRTMKPFVDYLNGVKA